jgi:hypothetical protein
MPHLRRQRAPEPPELLERRDSIMDTDAWESGQTGRNYRNVAFNDVARGYLEARILPRCRQSPSEGMKGVRKSSFWKAVANGDAAF